MVRRHHLLVGSICLLAGLVGCAQVPEGPGVQQRTWQEVQLRSTDEGMAPVRDADPIVDLPDRPSLAECQLVAAARSDALRVAFHRWQQAVSVAHAAGALPDPRLTYGYYIHEVETRVGPQRQSVALAQTFPWLGKLQSRTDASAAAARAQWHRFQQARLTLRADVADAYAELYYLSHALRITRENVALLGQLEQLILRRYEAQAATHPDVVRLQVELGKLVDRQAALAEMRRPALATLAAAMGLDGLNAAEDWPAELPAEPAEAVPADRAALRDRLIRDNPLLQSDLAEADAAEARIRSARLAYWPDVTLSATYIDTGQRAGTPKPSDSGQDATIAMVSVNLPIWRDKLAAGVRQARHQKLAVLAERDNRRRSLLARLERAWYEMSDAQRRVTLYQEMLLPKARESYRVTQRSFTAGGSSFIDLIDAQRTLLEFELARRRAEADRAAARAELVSLLGVPSSSSTSSDTPPIARDASAAGATPDEPVENP